MATGRPTKYTDEIADYICENLSKGITLSEICRQEGMPNRCTVYDWMKVEEDWGVRLSQRIAGAREAGFEEIAEDCMRIADFTAKDTVETEYGPKPDMEWIARSKLRVETRLKLLSKWMPKKYGDKLDLTTDGDKLQSAPPQVVVYNCAPPLATNEDEVG